MKLKCEKCGRDYSLGTTGVAATYRISAEIAKAKGVAVVSSDADDDTPDAIAPTRIEDWNPAKHAMNNSSVAEITRALSKGQKRRWNCRACGCVQNYPPGNGADAAAGGDRKWWAFWK